MDAVISLPTVCGPVHLAGAGVADAHSHVWIAPVAGAPSGVPVLNNRPAIEAELVEFHQAGGNVVVDCQPGGCGRDGRVLRELADSSGVHILASTGFHLRKYYPPDYWLFQASQESAAGWFVQEIKTGLDETLESDTAIRAGLIKVAFEEKLENSPLHLFEAAVQASKETGATILAHTEKGASAERIVELAIHYGLPAERLVLCHLDKRPDYGLHLALALAGILLEYDTFYRPKYLPEENVWPLLERMVTEGFDSQVAIATDMADPHLWRNPGNGPGLIGFFTHIIPRMRSLHFPKETIDALVGGNIFARLARPLPASC